MTATKKTKENTSKKNTPWPEHVQEALKNLPNTPGVYEMMSVDDQTLYVGKAKDLRKRVQSYFREKAKLSPRIGKMREKTTDIRWTEVSSEMEALILEANLIKEKRPKFNILLRDDKSYAYFCVTVQEDFPRVILTRQLLKDGNKYFGPKTSSSAIRKTIDVLQEILLLRSTPLEITEITPRNVEVKNSGNIKYPCLNYHIGKCAAPCIGAIAKSEYALKIEKTLRFLAGDTRSTEQYLQEEMQSAAQEKKFERAARMRDLLQAVHSISQKQIVSAPDEFSADVIGMSQKFERSFFHVFQLREGKIINSETFVLPEVNLDETSEPLLAFLRDHAERTADFARYLIVSAQDFPVAEQELWEQYFQEKWQQKVEISLPQKGKRKKLLEMAEKNAESYALRNAASFLKKQEDLDTTLEILQKKLKMKKTPKRIECYDISHFGGTQTVASLVVMKQGEIKNSDYRHFKLKNLEHGQIDDFKSMQEVLARRLKHIPPILPEGYTVQKLRAKKDQERVHEIILQEGKKFEITDERIINYQLQMTSQQSMRHIPDVMNREEEKNIVLKEKNVSAKNTLPKNVKLGDVFENIIVLKDTTAIVGLLLTALLEDEQEQIVGVWRDKKKIPNNALHFLLTKFLEGNERKKIWVALSQNHDVDLWGNLGFEQEESLANSQFRIANEKTCNSFPLRKGDRGILNAEKKISSDPSLQKRRTSQLWVRKNIGKHKQKKESLQQVPDLIVIDGGKGQLSSAFASLKESGLADVISICSLAKKQEEVFVPGKSTPIAIEKNSPEGRLLQRLRDEAHRFAITYNKNLRQKSQQKSVLDTIRGIGVKTKKKLLSHFGSVQGINQASDEQLQKVVGEKICIILRRSL